MKSIDENNGSSQLFDAGAAMREHVLGSEQPGAAPPDVEAFGRKFRDVATTLAWGGVWCRTGLSLRDRSLITVAVLAALNRVDELAMHLPPAIRNGLQLDELEEALIHVGIYAGFPAASTAISVGQRALKSNAPMLNKE